MTERKGVFTPEHEDFIAKVLDDLVKSKNPFVEMFDGMVFKVLIQTADNQGLDKISEEWKAELIKLVDAAMAKDWEEVRRLSVDLAVKEVTSIKDAETSLLLFDGVSKIIRAAIEWYVLKNIPTESVEG